MTKPRRADLTAAELRRLLSYDPVTGLFRWRVRGGSRRAIGDVAGCVRPDGYVVIGLNGTMYLAHRLAWLYETGVWPSDDIDHRDRDTGDNRFERLREATVSQNHCNLKRPVSDTSGFKGVTWHKHSQCWQAQIKIHGKSLYLGSFADPAVAHAAYVSASARVHGEFGRTE